MPRSSPLCSASSAARSSVHDRLASASWASIDGHVGSRHAAAFGHRHDHVQSGEHRLGDAPGALGSGASERVDQDRLDAPDELGREPIAGHVDQAGEEPSELVFAHEEPHTLALVEAQDPHCGRVQLVLADLEQLVARERVEDRSEVLPGVRVAGKPGAVEDRIDLAAQQRDVERRGVVRRGGPEAEEHVGSDAHLLHVDRSVHGGARVGLPHGESGVRRRRTGSAAAPREMPSDAPVSASR